MTSYSYIWLDKLIDFSPWYVYVLYTYKDASDNGKEGEPDPEENVDLLVDDVQWENTEAVFRLHSSGRTKLVEGALGYL